MDWSAFPPDLISEIAARFSIPSLLRAERSAYNGDVWRAISLPLWKSKLNAFAPNFDLPHSNPHPLTDQTALNWWKSVFLTNLMQRRIDDWAQAGSETTRSILLARLTELAPLAGPFVFAVELTGSQTFTLADMFDPRSGFVHGVLEHLIALRSIRFVQIRYVGIKSRALCTQIADLIHHLNPTLPLPAVTPTPIPTPNPATATTQHLPLTSGGRPLSTALEPVVPSKAAARDSKTANRIASKQLRSSKPTALSNRKEQSIWELRLSPTPAGGAASDKKSESESDAKSGDPPKPGTQTVMLSADAVNPNRAPPPPVEVIEPAPLPIPTLQTFGFGWEFGSFTNPTLALLRRNPAYAARPVPAVSTDGNTSDPAPIAGLSHFPFGRPGTFASFRSPTQITAPAPAGYRRTGSGSGSGSGGGGDHSRPATPIAGTGSTVSVSDSSQRLEIRL